MKECARFAPMIGARPGELPDEEMRALAEHLATCDVCQARLADEEALAGMLPDALMEEANRRDFSRFSDEVLARIPEYAAGAERVRPSTTLRYAQDERSVLSRLGAWARRHRAAAIASVLAPAAVAAALVVYFDTGGPPEQHAAIEVTAEGRGTTVLETNEGPVVLIGNGDSEGT